MSDFNATSDIVVENAITSPSTCKSPSASSLISSIALTVNAIGWFDLVPKYPKLLVGFTSIVTVPSDTANFPAGLVVPIPTLLLVESKTNVLECKFTSPVELWHNTVSVLAGNVRVLVPAEAGTVTAISPEVSPRIFNVAIYNLYTIYKY